MIHLRSTSLLDSITIEHGPLNLLSRMLLRGDSIARQRGVTLSFATLDELAEINARNRGSWLPLFPTYDPKFWGASVDEAFCIVGRDHNDEVVATQALRVYDWPNSNFAAESESLRFFYRNPKLSARAQETCTVTAAAARHVSGRVAFSGGIWFHPDFRGRYLTGIMVRIGRAYALGRWNIDYLTAMMSESVFAKGLSAQVGHTNVDEWVSMNAFSLGDIRLKFMWMTMPEMLDDMSRFLMPSDVGSLAQADAVIWNRYANQH